MALNPIGDSQQTISKTINSYPVDLEEAKRHLRVETFWTEDDSLITDLIKSATGYCEDVIQKDIANTSNEVNIYNYSGQEIKIWEGNYNELTNIITDSSTEVTPTQVFPYYEYVLMEIPSVSSDPLTVNFITGYDASTCPQQIKQAILIKVADFYDVERQGYNPSVLKSNDIVDKLLGRYKNMRF